MNNGYSICLNEWLEDERIKTELRLLLKISSLTAEKGYCFASNSFFAKYFKTSTVSVSKQIKKLESFGYLEIHYSEDNSRRILLKKTLIAIKENLKTPIKENLKTPIKENFKHNSISINSISINSENTPEMFEKEEVSFIPSLAQVMEYFKSNGYSIESAKKAFEYYSESISETPKARYWKDINGNPIKNWKMKMRSVWFKPENLVSTSKEKASWA